MGTVEARLAQMRLTHEGRVIEVYYREGLDLDVEGLMEVQLRRKELTTERCAMISFFQPGSMGGIAVMEQDYFRGTEATEQLIAIAVVSENDLARSMFEIYNSYHPQTFPTKVFRNAAQAWDWIAQQLATGI